MDRNYHCLCWIDVSVFFCYYLNSSLKRNRYYEYKMMILVTSSIVCMRILNDLRNHDKSQAKIDTR